MHEITVDNDIERVLNLMRRAPRFDRLSDDELKEITSSGSIRDYKAGETIIKEGEFDCWIYFLICGRLEIIKNNKTVNYFSRLGDMFGEMSVIDGSPRSATVMAASPAIILGVDASLIDNKLKNSELSFCYVVYRLFAEVLADRLRTTTAENLYCRKQAY